MRKVLLSLGFLVVAAIVIFWLSAPETVEHHVELRPVAPSMIEGAGYARMEYRPTGPISRRTIIFSIIVYGMDQPPPSTAYIACYTSNKQVLTSSGVGIPQHGVLRFNTQMTSMSSEDFDKLRGASVSIRRTSSTFPASCNGEVLIYGLVALASN